jgi:hypothetical protein
MNLGIVLGLAALAASIYLLLGPSAKHWAIGAAIASGVQVAMAFGWISLRIADLPLHLLISIAIAVCGGVLFFRVNAKGPVAAATVVAFVGLIRLLSALQ